MKTIRRLPSSGRKVLYLTFDDGPESGSTEPVIELLDRHDAKATFFVIGRKARDQKLLLARAQNAGHGIGNHSWDHGYSRFFRGKLALRQWIEQAETSLQEQLGRPTVGFRPPAGVRTPELHAALRELKMPLVLWNTRFFDTRLPWTRAKAARSLKRARSGDIILLHDFQTTSALPGFMDTLGAYLDSARDLGFIFESLDRKQLDEASV